MNVLHDQRRQTLDALQRDVLDVFVIGGGIVGAGVARDAAMRGLRVALLDQNDFSSGTSSRSSRMLHGGIRYLAQGRIGLVREASVEKVIVHKIAPHLAAPLPFIFPTRRGTEWKRWKLSIGVKIYDLLAGKNFGKSRTLSRDEVLSILPQLNPQDLTGAVRYFDGMTNDARLVLDTLRSAHASGAALLNYAAAERPQRDGDAWRVQITDRLTDATIEIRSKTIVNAAGAWADRFPASQVKLRLTKGVHLVIDRARLNIPDAITMTQGSRVLFAIPWGERVILGTTDTDYSGPLDTPTCEPEDLRYILDVTNHNFPSARITADDVISTWAGLRPLIGGGGNEKGKPSDISRAHQIRMTEPGWIDVAGGKLTTYRLMAEQTIDAVIDFTKASSKPSKTADTPLLPDEPQPRFSGILPPPVSRESVEHYCGNEWAVHLYDVMTRRTSWRYYHRDHLAIAEQVARWMGEFFSWDDDRVRRELAEYRQAVAESANCVVPGAVDEPPHEQSIQSQQPQPQQQVQPA
jgi:glycerol-3-phosphate dehydrogenase